MFCGNRASIEQYPSSRTPQQETKTSRRKLLEFTALVRSVAEVLTFRENKKIEIIHFKWNYWQKI